MSNTKLKVVNTAVTEKRTRTARPAKFFYKITDENGEIVKGATLEVIAFTRSADEALNVFIKHKDVQMKELTVK